MLVEVEHEALHCFDRTTLERLQMHSRYLRDLVKRHARTLPLRHIHYVNISRGRVHIELTKEDEPIVTTDPVEEDLETLFHRINNSFIHRLKLSFCQVNLPLPYYLRANAEQLQCQIRSLHIRDTVKAIDYALVDFLGVHLRPQIYELTKNGGPYDDDDDHYDTTRIRQHSENYAMLFTRNALRASVKHLVYELFEDDPDEAFAAPLCIIPELFGVNVVETCAIKTNVDPHPWIVEFIEMFEMAESGTAIVRQVTLLHTRTYSRPWRPNHYEPQLGQPRLAGVPAPLSAFIKNWMTESKQDPDIESTTETTVSDLFVFKNSKAAKKLQIFMWTVKQVDCHKRNFLHYAFLLQVVDM